MRNLSLAAVLALAALTMPAHASLFEKKPSVSAEEAAAQNLSAVTIWIDASWGFRNQGAASNLTKSHSAFAGKGYKVVDVSPYIENGDLQGFFVTYQKP